MKPVIIKQNTSRSDAIEFLEAKNPLVVENSPISANANTGKLINGDRNVLSMLWCQEKTNANALVILFKKLFSSKFLLNINSGIISGRWKIPIPSTINPPSKTINVITSGNFGRSLTIKRKCGWNKTNRMQKTAKYIIYGVKTEINIAIVKAKQYNGFGLFSPWILEPSQRSRVGQRTSIIKGVPEPAKNKNGVDNITKQEASKDTLL